uniref:PKD domain-containing protein n=1 Tax=Pedobacter schmidteae TaxID=2201271 RepID=UPI000EB45C12|nr:PKD domain-containing protein [Pedobacter schmidteae]
MVKRLLLLTIILVLSQITVAFSQITIDAVAPGPYSPGSSIAATFAIQSTCIRPGNIFNLYLVRPDGIEIATPIGSYAGFYSTFVNGVLPNATIAPPATGYSLRIKTTNPVLPVATSGTFEIRAGTQADPILNSFNKISETPRTFGLCEADTNTPNDFEFTNESNTGNVVVTINNTITPATTATLTFTTTGAGSFQTFTADKTHYTMLAKATMPDGSVGTKAYFLINNPVITAFETEGGITVCYPTGRFEYTVGENIKLNFPGNIYKIDWGDGSAPNQYTYCDIVQQSSKVSHLFSRSSCGLSYTSGNQTFYNAFAVNVGVVSPFCNEIGRPLSSPARVITRPINAFKGPSVACLGSVTFENTSVAGDNPNTNSQGCTPSTMRYSWFVNGVPAGNTRDLTYNFTTTGEYIIRLVSTAVGGTCQADPVEERICIQAAPIPSFTLPADRICLTPGTLTPDNTSVPNNTCSASIPVYTWTVRGPAAVTYQNNTNANSPIPQFKFTQPGVYYIQLAIQSATCSAVTTEQKVVVNTTATATLSNDITLCNIGNLTFDPAAVETRTIIGGSYDEPIETYEWTITGGNYTFVALSDKNSKYPTINFSEYKEYTVTLKHTNSCNTAPPVTQKITFSQAPVVEIEAITNPICNNATVDLKGKITGGPATPSLVWTNSANSSAGFSNPNDILTTYTPTAAERTAGIATLFLTLNTGLQGACAQVSARVDITILPKNTVSNLSNTKSICTGNPVDFIPTSLHADSFTWTATNADGLIGNLVTSGTGNITNALINTSATTDATVVYTIIPHKGTCDGEPFILTVTVTPKPILTATPAQSTICSGSPAGIVLTPNLPNTKYIWTSATTAGTVTGHNGSATPVAISAINETLINTGTSQGTVTYKITPISEAGCPGNEVTVSVNVDPEITPATAGTSVTICNATTYKLDGNQPKSNETGTWELTSGQTGVTFSDTDLHSPKAIANGLVPGIPYVFKWTISAPGACAVSSALVTITVIPPTVPGTIDGTQSVCANSNSGSINLTGNIGNVVRWESSTDGGTTWQQIANTTTTLTYLNLTTTTQYRAIVRNGNCDEKPTNTTIITVTPAGTQANAGAPQTICGGTTVKLDGNLVASGETGVWSVVAGSPPVHIVDPSDPKTEVQNLITGQSYTFTWTITGSSACGPSPSNVTVNVLPLIDKNTISSTNTMVCAGQTITLTGSQPIGGDGTYHYLWEVSTDAGATWTTTGGDTRDLSFTITLPTRFRRTVTSSTCTNTSVELSIDALPPIGNNSISADQAICTNEAAVRLTGTTPQGAGGGFNYEWEFSIDGGLTWTSTNTFQPDYLPIGLTQTTQYRRIVSTITCNGDQKNISNVVTVTIKPDAIAKFTFVKDKDCAPFQITAANITAEDHPAENATYTWYAGTDPIGTGINFPGHLISNSNESVLIKLVVTPKVGCNPKEFSWTFSTNQAVPASFGLSETVICGPKLVAFTNTSLQGIGATFSWKVGNTQISTNANPPPYNFQPDPSGKDTTYVVTLYSITSCGIDSAKGTVLVKSPPRPIFSPQTTLGCSPLPVKFNNNSPLQSDIEYFFDFGDGSPVVRMTDRNSVTHEYTTTNIIRTYNATLTAKNQCGTVTTEPYAIVVRPNTVNAELVVNGNQIKGCAPYTVTFDNNSTGASNFFVDFKDGTAVRPSLISPERFTHTFTTPGSYDVTLTATNGCSTSTKTVTIIVDPQPLTAFDAVNKLGCTGLEVKFINNTQNGMSYLWDFGDGSPTSTETEPTHTYSGTQEYYTVTLTATNGLGCPMTVSQNNFIRIVQPPVAAFNVDPSTLISIPDYTFRFQDQSTNNPTIWEWDFGDGTGSALRNPSHTYLDTGTYKVTLKTINQQGCFTTTFKNVTIKGVPGYLFVPNSFVPGSTQPELREFRAKGSGLQTWRFSIFNKWGQLLWESTKLEEGRPAEGWDGTFKGQQMPQGVYYWKIDVQMVNGSEWKGMTYDKSVPKRTGAIHLIR